MDTAPLPTSTAGVPSSTAPLPSQTDSTPPRRLRRRLMAIPLILVLAVAAFILLIPLPIPAGSTIVLDPDDSGHTLEPGITWVSKVYVRTDQPVNAVDATITFPAAQMQVTNVDTTGTAFGVVLFEPKVDNTVGTVRFIQANPEAYEGETGLVGTITFKVQSEGKVDLGVGTATITSADGQAKNTYMADDWMTIWQWLRYKVGK